MSRRYWTIVMTLVIILAGVGLAHAAGTTVPPATLGSKTLAGFGGSAGAHELFLQDGSTWKGDLTGIGAGPTWSMVILDIDVTGVSGPADRVVYFNLQDADNGSHFKNLGISCRLQASGAAGGTLLQCFQQFTSEGLSSHGLNPGELTVSNFDLRFDFTKANTADGWTITPYFRLSGGSWTQFFDGPFTATVGGIDFDAGKIAVGFDSGADGSLSFGNLYLSGPAGDVYVDDAWVGLPDGTPVQFPGQTEYRTIGIDAFDEIQEGIDHVSGSTVNVAAGTYTQKLFVNKQVRLLGAQAGVDARGRTGVEETVIFPNAAYCVVIQADSVTIDGVTITSDWATNSDVAGIYVSASIGQPGESGSELNGIVVKNTIIRELTDGLRTGGQGIHGIVVGPKTDGVELADNEIRDLYLIDDGYGYTPLGIMIWGNPGQQAKNTHIHDCLIYNLENDDVTVNPRGIQASMEAYNTTIADNEIYNVIRGRGMRLHVSASGAMNVTGNFIHDCGQRGISVELPSTLSGNIVTACPTGIWVNANGVMVNGNSLSGNTTYGVEVSGVGITVNATGNWWGNASGPYHATTNAGGSGDAVTDGADYSPWWGQNYMGDAHADPWAWYLNTSNSSTIQEGIDGASPGDTVNVLAGVYNENPDVNKTDLVLLGQDKTTTFIMTTSASGMAINASGVTMAGFTVKQNNNAVVQKDLYIGLSAWVSDIAVKDCIFDGTGSTKSGSMGIQVRQANGVFIEGIESFGWTGYGVNVYNAGPPFADDVLITDSYFHDHGSFGVSIDRSTNVRVRECTITGAGGSGVAIFADNGKPATGAEITGCTIQGPFTSNGIMVVADSALIQNNEIYDVSATDTRAIRITTAYWPYYSADGNMVTNNFIHDNDIGLLVDFGTHDEPTGNVIFENRFTNNTLAVNASECTQPLDASGNWWGSNEAAVVGALMSGMADYTPWLHDSTDVSTDPGFQGDFSHLHVDDDSEQSGVAGRITEGVGMVAGSIVEVEPGVYDEIIEFTDSLSNLTITGSADAFGLSSDDTTLSVVTGGVVFSNTSGEISGVTLENLYLQGRQAGYRVIGNAYQHKAVKGFTLRNCVVDGEDDPGRDGIMVDSGGGREGFGGNLTIDHVEFKDILHYGVMELFDGTVVTPFDTVTFTDSWVHECDGVVAIRGHETTPTASVVVSINTWENIGDNQLPTLGQHWAALEINRAQSVQVVENTIDHVALGEWGEGEALQMWDIGALDVHDNHFTNCYQGIFIWGNSGAFAVPSGAITHNDISGNDQYGIMLDPTATGGPLNAEANWWGAASGPQHASNPGGTGDVVSDNVDYSPWWGGNYVGQPHPWVWYVNPSSGSTIQEAIDAAGDGDIIDVAAGTYPEYLHITKDSLTIQGVGIDQSVIELDGLLPYWHYSGSSSYAARGGVLISGYGNTGGETELVEGVTFKGFTVQNAGLNPPGGGSYPEFNDPDGDGQDDVRGLLVESARGTVIEHCKVQAGGDYGIAVGRAPIGGKKYSQDIVIDSCTVQNNHNNGINVGKYAFGTAIITGNTLTDNKHPSRADDHSKGMQLQGQSDSNLLTGVVSGNTLTGNAYHGINIYKYTDGFLVEDNVVTGHNLHSEGAGIFLNHYGSPQYCQNHVVRHNQVTSNIRGIVAYFAQQSRIDSNIVSTDSDTLSPGQPAIKIDNSNAITATGNEISCDGIGIGVVGGSSGNSFTDNTITDALFAGVFIGGGAYENTFIGNTITGTDSLTLWGGETYQETQGDGVFLDDDAGPGNVFHQNAIYDNLLGGMESQVDTAVVDAGHNWWGQATGPYHPASNPSGTGNGVSDYVDYSPWWGANYIGDPHATPWVWYVNDVYGSTIGEAIDEASDGDTVYVSPGTYEEQIVLTQNDLQLIGSGDGSDPGSNTIILAPNSMSWYFTASADNYPVIGVDGAGGVGIRQLRVDGAGRGNTNTRFVGIGFWNGDGEVDNCCITNIKDTPFSGAQHGVGIYAFNDDTTKTYDIAVTKSAVDEFQKTAMALSGKGLTAIVDSCTVTGAGPTGVTAQNGIQIGYDATGSVTGCQVSGIDYTGSGWSASGLMLYYPSAGAVLSGNDVHDCQGALNAYFAEGLAMSGNEWTDNEFVYVWGGDGGSILGDDFSGNEMALYIADATNLNMDENVFDGNDYAIIVDGLATNVSGDQNRILNSTACGVIVQPYGADEPTGVVLHGGDISGNAYGVSNSTADLVDAEQNWWGDASGPTTAKGDASFELIRPLGPSLMEGRQRHPDRAALEERSRSLRSTFDRAAKGTGDAVSTLVDYSPWWGGDYLGDPHTSPWQWYVDTSNNSGIQEGIDDASPGDTVNVTPDTYPENVNVNKTLTVRSTGGASVTTVDAGDTGHGFKIAAADVLLDGFTIVNAKEASQYLAGVWVDQVRGSEIRNHIIHDCQHGIYFYQTAGGAVNRAHHNTVYDSKVIRADQTDGIGIIGWGDGTGNSDLEITDNEIYTCDRQGIFLGGWPNTCRSTNVTVAANIIHDNGQLVAALVHGYGVQIDFVDHSVIEENEIYNHGDWSTAPVSGYYQFAIIGSACDSNLVRNNHCYHNKYGICLGDRGPFEDPNNTSLGNQITNNFVEQNYRAIYITYDTTTAHTSVQQNDLSGCTDLAVRKYPATSGEVLDASANWFGTIDPDTVAALVTADYVDYSPWLHRGDDLSADPGFQPDLSYLHVDDDSPISGAIAHIQEGVNMVDDDTVQVEPGLYEEQVVITTDDLALLGAGCGSDPDSASIIKSPVDLAYSFNTGSSDNYPIVGIDGATGVRIEDFSIDGAGRGNANYRFEGIAFWNGDGSVERCCLTGVRDDPFSGAQHGVGIYAYNDGTKGTYDIAVTNTTVDDFQKTAMALSGEGLTVDLTGCAIAGAGATDKTAQNGIQIGFGAGGAVTDCSVEGIAYTGSGWAASGMLFYNGTTIDVGGTCTLTGCQASIIYQETDGTATGVVVNSAGIESEEGVSIRDYASEKGFSGGLSFRPAAPLEEPARGREAKGAPTTVVLSDLHLTGNHGLSTYGVAAWSLGDDVDVTLTDSEIRDWEIGVVAYEDVSTVELTANHNDISSNDMGYYSNAAAMQNAMSNWWGEFPGPLQATTNPTALGDEVSDLVDYSPWWTASYVGDPHADPWSWGVNTSNGSGIQEGVDSASVADTVNAMADTYEENVIVNKTLVLRGAQAGIDARGRMADEALITASSGHLVDIQADAVVFDGFKLEGSGSAGQLLRAESAGNGLRLMNNIMTGTAQSILWFGTTASDVFLFQNELDASSMSAAYGLSEFDAASAFDHLTIQENSFSGGELFAGNKNYNSTGLLVSGNLFDDAVLKLSSQFQNATIEKNTFINNGYTNLQAGLKNSLISGNTFHNAAPLPWVTSPSYTAMLWGNQYGLAPSQNVDIENNFFYFNEVVAPDEISHGLRILSGIDASTIEMFDNSFVNGSAQTGALAVVNEGSGIADASGNWWSSNDPKVVKLVSGGGIDVDYTPWLDTSLDAGDPGFQGDFSTLWVDDDSPQNSTIGRVQEGVDLVTGSLVNVVSGTYEEQVEIDQTLTLLGFGPDSSFIHSPATLTKRFTTGAANYPIIYVHHADDVDIEELTVDGLGRGVGNYRFVGIAYYNAGGTIQDCRVVDIREEPYSGDQHGVAIYAYTDTAAARTLNLLDCIITGYQKNAMALSGDHLTAHVDGCQVTGYGPADFIAQNGIQLGYGAAGSIGTVNPNTVMGHSYTPHDWAASGILVLGTSGTVEIKNNIVSENSDGIFCLEATAVIEGNDVSATQVGTGVADYWGVICDPGGQRQAHQPNPFDVLEVKDRGRATFAYTLEGNTIGGDDGAGSVGLDIWCDGIDDLVATGCHNTITGFDIGVQVDEESSGLISATFLNWNDIYDNVSYGVYNGASLTVDARYCWWGDATGPYHPALNAGGLGNRVSDQVLFDPWLGGAGEPDLVWSTFLGGADSDEGYGIDVDDNGNVYLTGYTRSTDFPTTAGVYDLTYNGNSDVFVAKLNAAGDGLVYATFLGGGDVDEGQDIAVDGSGNAYLTGWTQSSDFPVTAGACDQIYNGGGDAFAAKINATGTVLNYSTFLGGSGEDRGYGIAVGSSDQAHVVGLTRSSGFPATPAGYDIIYNGGGDVFILKLNAAGSALQYSTFLGGTEGEEGWDVVLNNAGNAIVTGYTASAGFPTTTGAFDRIHNGGDDIFAVGLNGSGSGLDFSTFVGGSGDEQGWSLGLDNAGNVCVCGRTQSSDFPVTAGAYDESYDGAGDVCLFMLNAIGSALNYATYLGEDGEDWGCGVSVDNTGHSYLVGFTSSEDFPTTVGAHSTTFNGGSYDAFVARINSNGSGLDYSTFLGGAGAEEGRDISLDGSGYVHAIGYTASVDFPTTPDAFDISYNGGTYGDVFATKLDIGVVVDKTPPETITDLSALLESGVKASWGNIYLSWSEPYDQFGIDYYIIYRSHVPGERGDSLLTTTETSYLDLGVVGNPNKNHYYIVRAVDAAGNKSADSNQAGEFDRSWGFKKSE